MGADAWTWTRCYCYCYMRFFPVQWHKCKDHSVSAWWDCDCNCRHIYLYYYIKKWKRHKRKSRIDIDIQHHHYHHHCHHSHHLSSPTIVHLLLPHQTIKPRRTTTGMLTKAHVMSCSFFRIVCSAHAFLLWSWNRHSFTILFYCAFHQILRIYYACRKNWIFASSKKLIITCPCLCPYRF